MADVKAIVRKNAVDSIHTVVENGKQKFLCYTRASDDAWVVVASDGADVWRREIDEEELDDLRDQANVGTVDDFLKRFKNAFAGGEVAVAQVGTKLTLTAGKGSSAVDFDLYEAKSAERKTELQTILFRLAEQTQVLETKLSATTQSLEKLRAQKGNASGIGAMMDLSPKKGGAQAKAKPRKTGMSVVNPGSRKRKAATGVVFD